MHAKHWTRIGKTLVSTALVVGLGWLAQSAVGQDPFRAGKADRPKISVSQESPKGQVSRNGVAKKLVAKNLLPKDAIRQFGSAALKHPTRVSSIRFSPDDRLLATADSNGNVRLWETETGQLVLEKVNGGGRKLAYSPDGKTIAIGGYYNQQIILWDLETNEYYGSITQNARCLEFSNDGKILYAAGQDKIVRAWNVKDRKLIHELKGHEAELYAIALSPDGKWLASAGGYGGYSRNNEIRLWNTESGELLGILDDDLDYYEKLPDSIYSLSFSRDGKTLASAGPYVVRLWDVEQKKLIDRISDITADVEFAPHEDRFVGCRKMAVYDLKTRKPEFKFGKEVGGHTVVEYSHDGKWIASGHDDGKIQLWNSNTGKEIRLRDGHDGGVRGVSVSAGGNLIASISREDNTIRIWGLRTGKELKKIEMQWKGSDVWWNEEGNGVLFAPYGQQVLSWNYDGTVTVCSLEQDRVHNIKLGKTSITALAFSPDGLRAAAMEYDSGSKVQVSVYELDGGKLIALIDPFEGNRSSYDAWIGSMAFTPDGKKLAIGALAKSIQDRQADSVQIWDLEKVELVNQTRPGVAPPGKLLFSPDGRYLATSSSRGVDLEIRENDSMKVVQRFKVEIDAHGRDPAPMAFSANGKLFAAAGANREISVWETLTWKKVKTFIGHQKAVTEIQFTPQANSLVSASEDGTLILWEVNKGAAVGIPLTKKQLNEYWIALADSDGDLAGTAMNLLGHSPEATVAMLGEKLDVGTALKTDDLPALISQLKQPDPKIHLPAVLKIQEFGKAATPFLFRELNKKLEGQVSARVEEVLETINRFPVSASELRRQRAIQILERIGSAGAKKVLQKLAESETRSAACLNAEAALLRLKKLERLNK